MIAIIKAVDSRCALLLPSTLQQELNDLVDVGLTPFEAIAAATREPAVFLHASTEFGTIQKGARADLILLRNNPLLDIHNASEKDGVMVRGLWLSASDLSQMLASLPDAYTKEDAFLSSALETQPERAGQYLRKNDPFNDLMVGKLLELVAKQGSDGLLKLYSRWQNSKQASVITSESAVNEVGSRLLASNQLEAAIEVFQFNAQRHPNSAEIFEQLADAYLWAADKEDAIKNYRVAARLNPNSEQLKNALTRLEGSTH